MVSKKKQVNNLNDLALELTKREKKKKQVSIAQVKELVKCLKELIKEQPVNVLKLLLK